MKAGDVETAERTFSIEDVRAFTAVSSDRGAHHVEPDAQGRLMVHGLLTATIFTEIGGRLNYLAREMHFEFIRPVFTGDRLKATFTSRNWKNKATERPWRGVAFASINTAKR